MNVRSTPTPLATRRTVICRLRPPHGALEDLDPLAIALDHLHRDANGIAGGDLRHVGAELLALELLDGVHRDDLVLIGA
jgi:hypothetical protein